MREGRATQLALEAVMAAAGGFGERFACATARLLYWKLGGGHEPGNETGLDDAAELAALCDRTHLALRHLIAAYDDPQLPYLAEPIPGAVARLSDFAQLARVFEWGAAAEGGEA